MAWGEEVRSRTTTTLSNDNTGLRQNKTRTVPVCLEPHWATLPSAARPKSTTRNKPAGLRAPFTGCGEPASLPLPPGDRDPSVDEAHCCDTSRSLQLMIGQHSKGTSSEQGYNSALVKQLLYRSDVSIQHLTELASLACTLQYLQNAY